MKEVGVTGGSGFIGRYTCEELLNRGYQPVVLDHHRRAPEYYTEGTEVMIGDVRDEVIMTEFAAHVGGIIHLAAVLGTQETIKNPRPAAESNLMGGLNFLEAVAQYDLPGVYIAVGNHWMNNTYSISKNMIERFVTMFNNDRDGRVNVVRVVNAYGPRQLAAAPYGPGKVRKITPAFVCRALSGQDIEVYGDGEQISDMVSVKDVAKGLVTALEKAEKGHVFDKAVEIGPAEHHTVNQVAKLIGWLAAGKTGKHVETIHLPMRPGETPGSSVTADTSTLQLVDMSSKGLVPLSEGMSETVDYFWETRGEEWHIAATA